MASINYYPARENHTDYEVEITARVTPRNSGSRTNNEFNGDLSQEPLNSKKGESNDTGK